MLPGASSLPGSQAWVSAADVQSGERVLFMDWRPFAASPVAGSNLAPGATGPDDTYTDSLGKTFATTGCAPGADFYTVIKVLGNAAGARSLSWSMTTSGGAAASSFMSTWWTQQTGSGSGTGYEPFANTAYYVERWCAPSAAALQGPLTFSLSADPLAPAYLDSAATADVPIGASLFVMSQGRCRIAPGWKAAELSFPVPGATGSYSMPAPDVAPLACSDGQDKLLSQSGVGRLWSWNVLNVLGTDLGANFYGYISQDAVLPPPAQQPSGQCPPGYSPMLFMEWFPQGADNVAWYVTLVSRNAPYFNVSGVNPLSTGVANVLRSINENISDAVNSNDPATALPLADPQGSIDAYCMANGLYTVTARQVAEPFRPGEIQVTDLYGNEVFAEASGLVLNGTAAEAALGGVTVYFAVGMPPGTVAGTLYTGQPDPQIDVSSATPGWAGCAAGGGSRLAAIFAGGTAWHASDVSWRIASASGNPTLMSGGGYQPMATSLPDLWCLDPTAGPYTLFVYDNNAVSAGNGSVGWCAPASLRSLGRLRRTAACQTACFHRTLNANASSLLPARDGGVLFLSDPTGCIIYEGAHPRTFSPIYDQLSPGCRCGACLPSPGRC